MSDAEDQTTQKHAAFVELVDQGMTMVHLDARTSGVDVPADYQNDAHLRLNFSHKFMLETFDITEDSIRSSLSFQGSMHICVIPWSAVFALTHHVTGEVRIWPEDIPEELKQAAESALMDTDEADGEAKVTGQDPPQSGEDDDEQPGRRVGHLRVIK